MNANGQIDNTPALWLGFAGFITLAVLCTVGMYHLITQNSTSQALTLTSAVMVGLALIVALMILLLVFYKITGVEDKTQALGLPVGSIRALLAFCLLIMFVGLGVFLYEGVNTPGTAEKLKNLTQGQVTALQSQFTTVIVQPATKNDEKDPRFDVTYYPARSKDADDFAKLMFTQVATVFVTVIGFYFGSSTAAAGVGAGVAAAGTATGKSSSPAGSGVPSALQEAKSSASDAEANLKRAQLAVDSLSAAPQQDTGTLATAQKALEDATNAVGAMRAKLDEIRAAAARYGTAPTDAENDAAAADVFKARDAIKQLATTVKADADVVEKQSKHVT